MKPTHTESNYADRCVRDDRQDIRLSDVRLAIAGVRWVFDPDLELSMSIDCRR
jgi:hypothetical protein